MRPFNFSRQHMTPEALESRRMKAVALFRKGVLQAGVAKHLGVSRTAVWYWHKAWEAGGIQALQKKKQGPHSKLSEKELRKVEQALLRGPTKYGYATELWTLKRITALIKMITGVSYGERSAWFVLGRLGWSCQKPERRSKERDEKAIAYWKKTEWPAMQKRGFVRM